MTGLDVTILFAGVVAGAAPIVLATLGETVTEKAGIIKRGVPCVVGPQHDAALDVIESTAQRLGAPLIAYGASPRATLAFSEASRAVAFLRGRGYVVPEDVKEIAKDVLRHRILLTYEAEAENVTSDTVIERILERVEVP